MKKFSAIAIVLLLSFAFFWSFYPQIASSFFKTESKDNSKQKNETVLRLGHNTPIDSALHQAALLFSKKVFERTKGKILIEVFPAQELGNDHEMLEMAREGTLDILLTPTAKMSIAIPAMQYADLPFFFPSREDLYDMLDGEPGRILLEKLHSIGLVGVTFWENGFKHFTSNHSIKSPEDFEGKKIRVMKSRMIMEQFRSFGAEPIAIDFHATKKALEDGVVDGQENPLIAIASMEFYKAQTHMTLSEHAYLGYVMSMSEKMFDKILPQHRDILIDTAKEVTSWEREETQRREASLIQKIKDAGVKVEALSEEERLKFEQKTKNIVKMFEESIGSDVISKTQDLLAQKYAQKSKDIVIGIDVALDKTSIAVGLAIKRGAEIAVDEINENGGVLGKKLRLVVKDNRISPAIGVKNVHSFIENQDVVAIIAGKHSGVVAKQIEHIQKAKIPLMIPWAAGAEIVDNGYDENYVFRIGANDKVASKFIVDSTLQQYKKPAVLVENSVWGRNNLEKMKKALTEGGVSDTYGYVYNRGETDFKNMISNIHQGDHDALILVANAQEGILIIKELVKYEKILPVMAHWGVYGGSFFNKTKEELRIMDFSIFNTFGMSKENKKYKELLEKYMDTYGKEKITDIKVPIGVAHSYDIVHSIAKAIEASQSLEGSDIKNALENLEPFHGCKPRSESHRNNRSTKRLGGTFRWHLNR